jgi:Tfp pilus assembly protein PilF
VLRVDLSVDQGDPAGVGRAIGFYEEAIARDPGFAPAYSGLAVARFAQEFWGDAKRGSNAEEVRRLSQKALELDPTLAEAHVMMARVLFNYDWDYQGAEAALKRALALAPQASSAYETYCWLLQARGQLDEALAQASTAASLDPRSPYMVMTEGLALHRARRFEEAEERYQRAIALDPGFVPVFGSLIQLYIDQSRFDEARAALSRREQLPSTRPNPYLRARLAAASGNPTLAHSLLADLPPMARGQVLITLGDHDRAFAEFDRALTDRTINPARLSDPEFDALRGDPRFARLVARVGLPVARHVALGRTRASQ